MFAISLFTLVVNFKTRFTPASVISAVLREYSNKARTKSLLLHWLIFLKIVSAHALADCMDTYCWLQLFTVSCLPLFFFTAELHF